MSFNNAFDNDLERVATNTSHKYKDFPEFEALSDSIENQLHHIDHTLLSSIRKDLLNLDQTPAEEDQLLAEKLSSSFKKCTESYRKLNEFVKQLNDAIKQIESDHGDVETVYYLKQKESLQVKLVRDSLAKFKNYQQKFEVRQQSQLPNEDQGDSRLEDSNEQEFGEQQQQQQQQQVQITYEPVNAEELEQQTLLIQEREREIHQIHQDTQEINNIFSNLSSIINEQQLQVDSIENNIFDYSSNARHAASELRSAQRYQRRSSGTLFCCLMILIGVALFTILIGLIF